MAQSADLHAPMARHRAHRGVCDLVRLRRDLHVRRHADVARRRAAASDGTARRLDHRRQPRGGRVDGRSEVTVSRADCHAWRSSGIPILLARHVAGELCGLRCTADTIDSRRRGSGGAAIRAGARNHASVRNAPHGFRSVDAARRHPQHDADASRFARRPGGYRVLRVRADRRAGAANNGQWSVLGLHERGSALVVFQAATASRRVLGGVRHRDFAGRNRDV